MNRDDLPPEDGKRRRKAPRAKGADHPKRQPKGDYEVGYCRPPVSTRFPPNHSGNKAGSSAKARRRRATEPQGIAQMLLREAFKTVPLRENGRIEKLTAVQAMMRALKVAGLKGSRIAQKDFIKLTMASEAEAVRRSTELMWTFIQYKNDYEDRVKERAAKGLPPPLPHPDDIILHRDYGTVTITGPRDQDELRWFAKWLAWREYLAGQIALTEQDLDLWEQVTGKRDERQEDMLVMFRKALRQTEKRIAETEWTPRIAGAPPPRHPPGSIERQMQLAIDLGLSDGPSSDPDDGSNSARANAPQSCSSGGCEGRKGSAK